MSPYRKLNLFPFAFCTVFVFVLTFGSTLAEERNSRLETLGPYKYEPKPSDQAFAKFNPRLAPAPGPLLLRRGDRLAIIGDSITEGWIRTGFSASQPSVAQPEAAAIWRASFGKYHAVNLGIGGDRVQDLGWRVQQGLLAPLKQVRVVVMLIGTNDLGNGETADVALTELKVLLQQVHAALPAARILTVAVFPRGGDEGVPRTPSFHRSGWWSAAANNHHPSIHTINRGLEQFAAAAPYATFVDCNSAFVRRAANTHNTYIPVEIMYDLLHLTPVGYKAWASCLLPELARVPGLEGRGACAGRSCRGDPGDDAAGVDLA